MSAAKVDVQSRWRLPHQDDDEHHSNSYTDKKHHKKKHHAKGKAKVTLTALPAQKFTSASMVVVGARVSPPDSSPIGGLDAVERNGLTRAGSGSTDAKESGDAARAGGARRQHLGMEQAANTKKMSQRLVKETRKKTIAREKADEAERKVAAANNEHQLAPQGDDSDSDDEAFDPTAHDGWLVPETRIMRRKAAQMRGMPSKSVERLDNDDRNHISAQRPYVRSGRYFVPRPFGRRLIEDRQELTGILNMPRNKRMRKAGIKETHLAILADVYKEVISNAHRRKEEDEHVVTVVGGKGADAVEKGVRVSLFATTLGISPFLFMREVIWASNHLYAHAVAGEMNRATWIFGCISLCLMSERELVEFVFRTCKITDKGELEQGELDRLARGLHLSNDAFWPAFSQQLADIGRAHANGEMLLTLDYFLSMHHKFPMILYPALRMQELVQRRTLGLHGWGRLIDRLDKYMARQKGIADGSIKPNCLCVLLGLK